MMSVQLTPLEIKTLEFLNKGVDFAPDMESQSYYSSGEYHKTLRQLEQKQLVTTSKFRISNYKNCVGHWSVWNITFQGRMALAAANSL